MLVSYIGHCGLGGRAGPDVCKFINVNCRRVLISRGEMPRSAFFIKGLRQNRPRRKVALRRVSRLSIGRCSRPASSRCCRRSSARTRLRLLASAPDASDGRCAPRTPASPSALTLAPNYRPLPPTQAIQLALGPSPDDAPEECSLLETVWHPSDCTLGLGPSTIHNHFKQVCAPPPVGCAAPLVPTPAAPPRRWARSGRRPRCRARTAPPTPTTRTPSACSVGRRASAGPPLARSSTAGRFMRSPRRTTSARGATTTARPSECTPARRAVRPSRRARAGGASPLCWSLCHRAAVQEVGGATRGAIAHACQTSHSSAIAC